MIFLKRRRLAVWLFKAYFKKWRKTIFLSFIFGLVVFFILRTGFSYFTPLSFFSHRQAIGVVGAYTPDSLPPEIINRLSKGLTSIDREDNIKPNIAKSWDIRNDGKKYIFYLNDNIYFNDGKKLTSKEINYNFLDVSVERPNDKTIIFNLKDKYSPFLVTVSRPIFRKEFTGVGEYKVKSIKLNGNFVESIDLVTVKSPYKELSYIFYPTEESLKTAFLLGEVSTIVGIKNENFEKYKFSEFKNAKVTKRIDRSQLVTIFYNTQDKDLSDKRLREALSYAIPDKFIQGERNHGPFRPNTWVSKDGLTTYSQDFEHAAILLGEKESSSGSAKFVLEIKTLPQYKDIAELVKLNWEKIGIKSKIVPVDSLPVNFQVFLGEFNVPKDPDQYTIWHSSQENNITNYKNLRIDKLLEDGRQTIDLNERKKIYSDFQKYFLDDPAATFLYFPYAYEVTRT
jgi:peptide/nickel transport system substrate-binding protein